MSIIYKLNINQAKKAREYKTIISYVPSSWGLVDVPLEGSRHLSKLEPVSHLSDEPQFEPQPHGEYDDC